MASDDDECWICLMPGGGADGPLFRPCPCNSAVHRQCLERWRYAGINAANATRCPNCLTPYRFAHVASRQAAAERAYRRQFRMQVLLFALGAFAVSVGACAFFGTFAYLVDPEKNVPTVVKYATMSVLHSKGNDTKGDYREAFKDPFHRVWPYYGALGFLCLCVCILIVNGCTRPPRRAGMTIRRSGAGHITTPHAYHMSTRQQGARRGRRDESCCDCCAHGTGPCYCDPYDAYFCGRCCDNLAYTCCNGRCEGCEGSCCDGNCCGGCDRCDCKCDGGDDCGQAILVVLVVAVVVIIVAILFSAIWVTVAYVARFYHQLVTQYDAKMRQLAQEQQGAARILGVDEDERAQAGAGAPFDAAEQARAPQQCMV